MIVFVKMLKIVFENYYIIQIFTLCTSLKKKLVKTNVILEKLWSFSKGFVWRAFVIMLDYIVLGDI